MSLTGCVGSIIVSVAKFTERWLTCKVHTVTSLEWLQPAMRKPDEEHKQSFEVLFQSNLNH